MKNRRGGCAPTIIIICDTDFYADNVVYGHFLGISHTYTYVVGRNGCFFSNDITIYCGIHAQQMYFKSGFNKHPSVSLYTLQGLCYCM